LTCDEYAEIINKYLPGNIRLNEVTVDSIANLFQQLQNQPSNFKVSRKNDGSLVFIFDDGALEKFTLFSTVCLYLECYIPVSEAMLHFSSEIANLVEDPLALQ
jgi:hypothetical protein